MPRQRWAWLAEVWRAIVGDRSVVILLIAALVLCGIILLLIWR